MNLITAGKLSEFPNTDKPEIAFIGRSNAGKSSLVNSLLKEKIAYTSKTAGKTITINFFERDKYFLVDMPGYGYSANAKAKNAEISKLVTQYLSANRQIKGIVQVCSILGVTQQDLDVMILCKKINCNYLMVLNKSDKLGNMQVNLSKKKIQTMAYLGEDEILDISCLKAKNINLLVSKINDWLK